MPAKTICLSNLASKSVGGFKLGSIAKFKWGIT
jgi:hypothetical protein